MFPTSATNDGIKSGRLNPVLPFKGGELPFCASPSSSDLSHLFFGELDMVVSDSMRAASTLPISVLGVVKSCAQKQMSRINASRNVALMANEHPIRNGAISHLVRDTVRSRMGTTKTGSAIAKLVLKGCPDPAIGRAKLIDATPKTLIPSSLSRGHVVIHCKGSKVGHLVGTYIGKSDDIVTQRRGKQ
jgi:hypothetical protein